MRGREHELELVLDLLQRDRRASGGTLLVEGEQGIGKSLLLAQAASVASTRGFSTAIGNGNELKQLRPLAPLLAAFQGSPGALGSESASFDLPEAEIRLAKQLRADIDERVASGPLLACLDDLHEADLSTLVALRTLTSRRLGPYPVSWILARRTPGNEAKRLFDALEHDGAARVELHPLHDDVVTDLVTEVLGTAPEADVVAVADGAGGNPFLLLELLAGLRDEGALEISGGRARLTSKRLPRRMLVVVQHRLDELSPHTRHLLETAAVLGQSFMPEDAAEMLGKSPATLLPAMEEALRAGVLVASPDEIAFQHELVWQAVNESMPAPVRQALHRQAGEMLMDRGGTAMSAVDHLSEGARHGDARVLAKLDQAAGECLPYTPQTAARIAERALELTDPASPDRFPRTMTAVAALAAAGRLNEATELVRSALAQPLSSLAAAQLRCSLSAIYYMKGLAVEARREAENVLSEPYLPNRLRDEAEVALLHALTALHDNDRAEGHAQAIMSTPERHSDSLFVEALLALSVVRWDQGRLAEGLSLSRAAVRRVSGSSTDARRIHPRLDLAAKLADLGWLDQAEPLVRAAREEIDARGHVTWAAAPPIMSARIALAAGSLDQAVIDADAGLGIANALETHLFTSLAHSVLGAVALRRGDLPAAARHAGGAKARLSHYGATYAQARCALVAAQVAAARDGLAAALSPIDHIYAELPEHSGTLVAEPTAAAWMVRAALAVNDRGRASAAATAADDIALTNPDFPVLTAAAAHARGLLDRDLGCLEEAATEHCDPWAAALAAEDLAILLTEEHARSTALTRLDQALAGYERTGATRDAARVRARLRQMGVRRRHWESADRPVSGWASLTHTESTVSGLVSQGLTNQQVADQMFVSAHTVAFHLRHVFRKLNIRSRVELARLVVEEVGSAADEEEPAAARRLPRPGYSGLERTRPGITAVCGRPALGASSGVVADGGFEAAVG